MSTLQEWVDAALTVADSEGMADGQIIPTWPSDVAGFYPTLTIGALRKWRTESAKTDSDRGDDAYIDIPACRLTLDEPFDESFKQILSDIETIFLASREHPAPKPTARPDFVPLMPTIVDLVEYLDPNGCGVDTLELSEELEKLFKEVGQFARTNSHSVSMPQSVDQARAMALLGMKWLEDNAPDQIIRPAGGVPEFMSDDYVERLARQAGWDNRKYMTPADYSQWCSRMKFFVRFANKLPTQPADDRRAFWKKLESFVHEFIEGYEFRGDEGD